MPMTFSEQLTDLIGRVIRLRRRVYLEGHCVEIVNIQNAVHRRIQRDINLIVFVRSIEALASFGHYSRHGKWNTVNGDAAPRRIDIAEQVPCRLSPQQRATGLLADWLFHQKRRRGGEASP